VTAMILPHAVLVHDDRSHHTMPPLTPLMLAVDPGLTGPQRLEVEAELIATYGPLYGVPFARRLLERARALRDADRHHQRTLL
jgi:hypothetical protein